MGECAPVTSWKFTMFGGLAADLERVSPFDTGEMNSVFNLNSYSWNLPHVRSMIAII
jgi:hypothetical protein